MRRAVLAVGSACLAGAIAGCGPVDAGSAFEEQFTPFLTERDAVADVSVASFNTLPWSGTAEVGLTLQDGLTDAEVVEEVLAIVSHGVDDQVRYSLTVRFDSPTADSTDGVAAAGFEVPGPLDPDDVREATAQRVASARALVALGTGPTRMGTARSPFPMVSQTDAFDVARGLCAEPEVARGFNDVVEIATGPVDPDTGTMEGAGVETARLKHDFGEDCSTVRALEHVLDEVRARTSVLHYRAETLAHTELDPTLTVRVETGESLDDLVTDAEAAGVRLTVTTPTPTTSPTSPAPPTPTPAP